jgi:hypothetical protein
MDEKEFLRLLSEVAEWKTPETLVDLSPRRSKNKKKSKDISLSDDDYDEQDDDDDEQIPKINETYPPQLVKLKCQAQTCDDCGKFCEHGRHIQRKIYESNKTRHWRDYCLTCKNFLNPYTKKFDLDTAIAAKTWNDYLRNPNRKKKPRPTVAVKNVNGIKVVENDQEIITFYDDHNRSG